MEIDPFSFLLQPKITVVFLFEYMMFRILLVHLFPQARHQVHAWMAPLPH